VCVDADGAVYTLNPMGGGSENATLMSMQAAFEGLRADDPEVKTAAYVEKWLKTRPPKSKLFLLGAGRRAYGIESVEMPAGERLSIAVRPWENVFEAAGAKKLARAQAEREQILEWKSFCDDEFIWW
jgi:hypothetical protein